MAMPVFIKESQNRVNATSITVTHSAAAPLANLLLAFIHVGDATAGGAITTPSGWTALTPVSGGTGSKLWPYWRFGDGSTTAWQWSTASSTVDIVGVILEYSTTAAVPIDTSGSNSGVSTSATAPTLSPSNPQGNFVLVAAFGNNGFGDAFPAPTAGTGTRTQRNTAAGTDDGSAPFDVWDWTGVGAANPTGTKTSSPIASLTWEGYAVAIAGTSAGVAVIPRLSERLRGPTSRAFKKFQRWPVPATFVPDPKSVTPGTASLTLTGFAPTVTRTQNVSVTPGVATLTLTRFAPTVTASDFKLVTPGKATLTLTPFAPAVVIGKRVTPGLATLTLTAFAPTVILNINVVPGKATLTTARFAPVVTVNTIVTPGTKALALTAFAPVVTTTNHKLVTPGTASLATNRFAPTVTVSTPPGSAADPPGQLPLKGVG